MIRTPLFAAAAWFGLVAPGLAGAQPAGGAADGGIAVSPSTPLGVNGTGVTAAEELHEAPQVETKNSPPEIELNPPADAEKVEPSIGYLEVENPAFPSRAPPPPVVHRGRRIDEADLAPYFATGNLLQAKKEFDAGHFDQVRTLLANEGNAPPVRYLRALAALRDTRFELAASEFAALADDYPAMRDRCLTSAAIADEELNRDDEAAALYAKVDHDSHLYADARLGMARVLRRKGDLAGARAALKPLADLPGPSWGPDPAASALLALADVAHAAKDPAGERDALLRLWSRHPLSPLAAQAGRRLGGKIPLEAQVTRAENLIELNRNRIGLALLAPLLPQLKLPDPLACRASFAYGKALRKERQHARAIAVLTPVAAQCLDPDLRPRILYVLGSSRSIVDIPHGAETYDALAREYPTHPFADDALFFSADLFVKNGDIPGALARLEDLAKRYPTSDFAGEALFKAFWLHRARNEVGQALAILDTIENQFKNAPDPYDVERARYWRARVAATTDPKRAADLYEALALDHPTTYYGYLARERLTELDKDRGARLGEHITAPLQADPIFPMFAGPMSTDPHFTAGIELLRLGFNDIASAELQSVNRINQPAESIRLLVHLLSLAGDAASAHGIARTSLRADLSGRITTANRRLWEIAYPHAFRDLVEKHCKPAKVDPDLLQALMREESALDPRALSWAGALGLTQLMLPTARSVARTLKIPSVNTSALLQPDLNIRIGAWYLGMLVRQFQGQDEFALAGYNAGGHMVNKWRAERPKLAIDEWVEEIPFSETRGYVKRVLRTYVTYQLLYPPKPLAPPTAQASSPQAESR